MPRANKTGTSMKQDEHLNHLRFEQAPVLSYPLVKSFYKSANYFSQVGKKDEVYVLRDTKQHNQIVAALRLVKTADYLILRSMVVSPERQRQGLGQILLEHLKQALTGRECWCYPFEWLESFYQHIGFITTSPDESPTLIRNKYQQYSDQGRKILIMRLPH